MVAQFMERAAENAGLPPRALSDDALAALRAYDWPGNVRQLRNIIEWVLIMAPGRPQDPVRPDMLPPEIRSEEHTSELQSLMRISYAVFCLKKKKISNRQNTAQ